MENSVLLGFSGGIDSVASALLLKAQRYDVRLITLDTTGYPHLTDTARESARKIGLPLRIADVRTSFKTEIIDYFAESYLKGETPAPCTRCNVRIKWKILYETAIREDIRHIATGHYFRIHKESSFCYVRKAADLQKDQSYYLWGLPQEYLAMALCPMGEQVKTKVKETYGTLVKERESMGVCFLSGSNYTDFLKEHCNGIHIQPGKVVDSQNKVVGRHEGCAFYTIGQKRGFVCERPGAVVTGIDAANNTLIIGQDKDLYYQHLLVGEYNIVDPGALFSAENINVKIRGIGRNPDGYASIIPRDGKLRITLNNPAWAPAKGQPVVFYRGEIVLGGGILENYW